MLTDNHPLTSWWILPATMAINDTKEKPMSDINVQRQQFAVPKVFQHTHYLVRRKIFKLFGAAFHIYDPSGKVAFYSKQKAFKLKEDIRVYTGEDMRTEVLTILARQILDFSAAYDVFDPATNRKVGALKRKGIKSIVASLSFQAEF
jgi:hypothetical protein